MEHPPSPKRASRAKKNPVKDLIDGDPNPLYSENLRKLAPQLTSLSPMELYILAFVKEGLTNIQIAEKIFHSERTVENHCYNARKKLGLRKMNLRTYLMGI
jgi:DNA-binding CsgD family transcriptional regulator